MVMKYPMCGPRRGGRDGFFFGHLRSKDKIVLDNGTK
jgi:hypothetical protein